MQQGRKYRDELKKRFQSRKAANITFREYLSRILSIKEIREEMNHAVSGGQNSEQTASMYDPSITQLCMSKESTFNRAKKTN